MGRASRGAGSLPGRGEMRGIAGIIAAVLLLAPAGCMEKTRDRQLGTGPGVVFGTASEEPVEPHNEADVAFARAMIEHHEHAMELVSLGETRARDPKIRTKAGQIRLVLEAEISQLTEWLEEWLAESAYLSPPVTPDADLSPDPSPTPASSPKADPSPTGHPATPTASVSASPDPARTLAALRRSSDDRFDQLFLDALIEHQERAADITAAEQQQGRHPGARELATRIAKAQRSEIEQLRRLGR